MSSAIGNAPAVRLFVTILWASVVIPALGAAVLNRPASGAVRDRYKRTYSRSPYTHFIDLYDASDRVIHPSESDARPYSPKNTCKKCHDYDRIARGYHFSTDDEQLHGRSGEPWLWTHRRTGTQIPVSYRRWPGTYHPDALGMSTFDFVATFGSHLCGGPVASDAESLPGRFAVSGALEVDCMLCHAADRTYRHAEWARQIDNQNFAWAATAALGLAGIKGMARRLPDDFDAREVPDRGVKTRYDTRKFDDEGRVFFDVVRSPPDRACYACHTVRPTGNPSKWWTHDADVHLRAGLTCADCHRNGIDHHTVRGYPGEPHPAGDFARAFTCRNCHMEQAASSRGRTLSGRFGAPRPLHRGLPPLHLESMSCTACHSGPAPSDSARRIQTAMAHNFGVPSQSRDSDDPPGIVEPVFLRNAQQTIGPHRMTWPAFWGWLADGQVTPATPDSVSTLLRRAMRIRKDFQAELREARLTPDEKRAVLGDAADQKPETLTERQRIALDAALQSKAADAFDEKLLQAFTALAKQPPGPAVEPVFVSGGRLYRSSDDGKSVVAESHPAAEPVVWPLGHDVRPARQSLGSAGCTDCHARDAPLFYGTVTAIGPAPDDKRLSEPMHQWLGEDPRLLSAWEAAFVGRDFFKWVGVVTTGMIGLVLAAAATSAAVRWTIRFEHPRHAPSPTDHERD